MQHATRAGRRRVGGLTGGNLDGGAGSGRRGRDPPAMSSSLAGVPLLLLLLTLVAAVGGETRSPRFVTTKYGKLRGSIRALPNKYLRPVEVFLGIPYATPPTGSNRFSPTRTPSPWAGERMADKYGPVCPQHLPDIWEDQADLSMPRMRMQHVRRLANYLTHQEEDCLYLNVYVPSFVADTSGHRALPVVVYIHGESFEWGASNPYDGSVLAAYGDVIVVTLNYRLGPLGQSLCRVVLV
ncbi:neuroligin 4-like [Penaeus japonicus]|uniref:neuroligin 4-like n=1 Tax=Penaeus japonicus TaxID=27405 RepID=UPI001C70DC33|nr:neuroligin 4-like [Penaeus japonicus]